jgi:hypothetical protein
MVTSTCWILRQGHQYGWFPTIQNHICTPATYFQHFDILQSYLPQGWIICLSESPRTADPGFRYASIVLRKYYFVTEIN